MNVQMLMNGSEVRCCHRKAVIFSLLKYYHCGSCVLLLLAGHFLPFYFIFSILPVVTGFNEQTGNNRYNAFFGDRNSVFI